MMHVCGNELGFGGANSLHHSREDGGVCVISIFLGFLEKNPGRQSPQSLNSLEDAKNRQIERLGDILNFRTMAFPETDIHTRGVEK